MRRNRAYAQKSRVITEGKTAMSGLEQSHREGSMMPLVFSHLLEAVSELSRSSQGLVPCSVSTSRGERDNNKMGFNNSTSHQYYDHPLTRMKSLITLITSSRVDHSSPTTARRSVFDPCAIFCTQLPDTQTQRKSQRGSLWRVEGSTGWLTTHMRTKKCSQIRHPAHRRPTAQTPTQPFATFALGGTYCLADADLCHRERVASTLASTEFTNGVCAEGEGIHQHVLCDVPTNRPQRQ